MTTTRSYRGARSIDEAMEELRRCKDTQFDAAFVDALIAAVTREGWAVVDTTDQVTPSGSAPSMGSDDDDPTAGSGSMKLAMLTVEGFTGSRGPVTMSELEPSHSGASTF